MDVWGDLPKSQVDNSTVDDEIDALIQAHLDDPDAHLEVGQSLQSHKASEIIDHLASSIIEDKIATGEISSRCLTSDQIIGKDFRTAEDVGLEVDGVKFDDTGIEMWQAGEKKVDIPISGDPTFQGNVKVGMLEYLKYTLQSVFDSIDGWNFTNPYTSAKQINTGYCEFNHISTYGSYFELYLNADPYFGLVPDRDKNLFFSAVAYYNPSDSCVGYIGMGLLSSESGFGFKFTQSGLYACWRDEDTVEHTSSITFTNTSNYHRFDIRYYPDVKVEWYVDGVLVKTKTWAEIGSSNGVYCPFYLYVKSNNTNTATLICRSLLFQQDY